MSSKLVCFFALIATAFAASEYIYPSGLPAYAPFAAVSSLGSIARFGSYNPYMPYSPYSPYLGHYASFAPAPIETAPIEAVRTVVPTTKIEPVATEVAAPISPFGLAPASHFLPYARIAPHPFASAYSFLKTIEAKKYPEGVDSTKCPNYPYCDHPELPSIDLSIPASPVHTEPQIPADVVGCPNYPLCDTPEIPAIDASVPALPMHTEPQIPADVVGCPNYPLCDTPEIPAMDVSIPALPMHTEPQIPANVDPAKCPNYPLCDVSAPIIVESA